VWCAWTLRRGELPRLHLRVLSAMTFAGWVSTLAGWCVTEIGRQPFLVYGLLRTRDLVGDHAPGTVLATLLAYLALYAFLLVSYVFVLRYMATKKEAK
jgi:cytochrome d ubiquinol oxidase subunit I